MKVILRQPCNSSRFFTDPLRGYLRLKWRGKEKSQSAPRSFIFSRKVCQTLFKLYLLPDTAASPVVHRVVGTSYNWNTARTEESGILKECTTCAVYKAWVLLFPTLLFSRLLFQEFCSSDFCSPVLWRLFPKPKGHVFPSRTVRKDLYSPKFLCSLEDFCSTDC